MAQSATQIQRVMLHRSHPRRWRKAPAVGAAQRALAQSTRRRRARHYSLMKFDKAFLAAL
jgi:hypothetical protein